MIHLDPYGFRVTASFEDREGVFVEGFLLNDQRNARGWKASWESIKACKDDFIGKPGIVYADCSEGRCFRTHTPDQINDGRTKDQMYADALNEQESYRVSNIIATKLYENTHTLTAVEQITDKDFQAEVKSGKPLYRSPGLWIVDGKFVNAERTMIDVDKWKAVHSAYVTFPAYGSTAQNTSTCIGDRCALHFQIGGSGKCTSCENKNLNRLYKKVKKTITS